VFTPIKQLVGKLLLQLGNEPEQGANQNVSRSTVFQNESKQRRAIDPDRSHP
jgi:hypothetical protein